MGAAANLRKQIEAALAGRIPAALSPRPLRSPELVSCGVAEVDFLLGGGLPLGAIVELTGSGSSGRTTLALSTLAGLTRRGTCCAYVDACDTLDPLSAAALGVELRRLLWVRPPEPHFGNTKSKSRVAHICPPLANVGSQRSAPRSDSYLRLDRALRATDLLLNSGGWGAVVLDLAELPPAQARRVPLATWYRFRLQAEKSRALLLLLTPVACANTGGPGEPSVGLPGLSCAAISLNTEETKAEWRRAAENGLLLLHPSTPTAGALGTPLLAELRHRMSVSRSRAARPVPKKPPVSHPTSAKAGRVRESDETWWTSALSWPG